MTNDHVIARSWYPGSTPPNTEKWKVPACRLCNNRFSRDEQDLFIRLAHCVDPKHPGSQDIHRRAKRAIDPSLGKNERDRKRRVATRQRFLRDLREVSGLPAQGVLPSFRGNFDLGSRTIVLVRAKLINAIIEKWARGLHYVLLGYPVPQRATVTAVHVEDQTAELAFGALRKHATMLYGGPGVEVMQFTATEDSARESLYGFVIWQQFKAYATVEEDRNGRQTHPDQAGLLGPR
jgi:hypothetical protein